MHDRSSCLQTLVSTRLVMAWFKCLRVVLAWQNPLSCLFASASIWSLYTVLTSIYVGVLPCTETQLLMNLLVKVHLMIRCLFVLAVRIQWKVFLLINLSWWPWIRRNEK